jgi:protoporphyrinogen IX oxidase
MIPILLKFVHIIAIVLWGGGLISLPFLYLQRRGRVARRSIGCTTSPASSTSAGIAGRIVAVGVGIALIFLQATFEPWFSVKLALVGGW